MSTLTDAIKVMNRKNTLGKVMRITGAILIAYGFHNTKKLIKDEADNIVRNNKYKANKIVYPCVGGAVLYILGTHTSIRACVKSSNAAVTEVKALTDELSNTQAICDNRLTALSEAIDVASLNMNKEHYSKYINDMISYVNFHEDHLGASWSTKPVTFECSRQAGATIMSTIK